MTANALIIDDGKLWAFLRSALQQGRDIQATYVGGSESYEHCSARVDVAAQELVTKFIAKFGAAHEPSVWPPAEEYERARRARAAPPPPAPVTTFDGERIAGVLCKNCCKPFLQHIVLDEYGRKNVCPPASAPPPGAIQPKFRIGDRVRSCGGEAEREVLGYFISYKVTRSTPGAPGSPWVVIEESGLEPYSASTKGVE